MHEVIQILFREARQSDIPEMAEVRAGDWGSEEYWSNHIRDRRSRRSSSQPQRHRSVQL